MLNSFRARSFGADTFIPLFGAADVVQPPQEIPEQLRGLGGGRIPGWSKRWREAEREVTEPKKKRKKKRKPPTKSEPVFVPPVFLPLPIPADEPAISFTLEPLDEDEVAFDLSDAFDEDEVTFALANDLDDEDEVKFVLEQMT